MRKIIFDYTVALKQSVREKGKPSHRIFKDAIPLVYEAINALAELKNKRVIGFTEVPFDNLNIQKVKKLNEEIQEWADTLVVVGIGGSSLGNKSLHMALNYYDGAYFPSKGKNNKKVYILDNLDSKQIDLILTKVDLNKTVFNIISKSGATLESIANFLVLLEEVRKNKKDFYKHFIFTTTVGKGDLYNYASEIGSPILEIPDNVGGRYSVLTPVGLFSTLFNEINIDQIIEGAKFAHSYSWEYNLNNNPAAAAALIYYLYFTDFYKNTHVFWSYSSFLEALGQWFCQLWAESLGKKYKAGNKCKNIGQTPLAAVGPRDQHSLWQLFVDGPDDKFYTFLEIKNYFCDFKISNQINNYESFDILKNVSLNEIISNEEKAIEFVLAKIGRPFVRFGLEKIDEFYMGQFIFLMEFITALVGLMLKINPFDQPGVEEGKITTYALLNHPKYQKKKDELEKIYSSYKKYQTS